MSQANKSSKGKSGNRESSSKLAASKTRSKTTDNDGNNDSNNGLENGGNTTGNEMAIILSRLDAIATDFQETKDSIKHIEKWIENREEAEAEATLEKNQVKSKLCELETTVNELKIQIHMLMNEQKVMREQNLKAETQSRRDNLVIYGIQETPAETDNMCLQKVYEILEEKMEISDAKSIKIVRCHRLGRKIPNSRQPRPIIFKLHWFGDRQNIWGAKQKLKGSNLFLAENFPAEIERRRRILAPIMQEARRQNKERRAYLVVDKLHIGNRIYTVDNLSDLPTDLHPMNISTPSNNDITAFFSSASPLSNFHSVQIKGPDGVSYSSSEQMYQHIKATVHKDDETAAKILSSKTPLEAYKLGKTVNGMQSKDWYTEGKAKQIMYNCVLAKFQQHQNLKDFLLATGTNDIAEGNPHDSLWGVALKVSDKNIFVKQNWKGRNWMGDILMAVREELKQ